MKLQWNTLLADDDGRFDWEKIKSGVAVVLALLGGVTLVLVAVFEVVSGKDLPTTVLFGMAGICVVPLTGGTIASALTKRKETAQVVAGLKPGRRESDPINVTINQTKPE